MPVVVFNSLSWPRTEVIEVEVQMPGPTKQIEVVNAAGQRVESQLLAMDSWPPIERGCILLAANTPALGYKSYFVRSAGKPATSTDAYNGRLMQVVKASANMMDNGFIRVKVDPQTGCITSLFDLRNQTEALGSLRNRYGRSQRHLPAETSCRPSTTSLNDGMRGTSMPISKNSIGIWIKLTR